jgi:integrase
MAVAPREPLFRSLRDLSQHPYPPQPHNAHRRQVMAGCRALTENEVQLVRRSFGGAFARRDEALFMLGVKAGFRISELISLRVKDVLQHGKIATFHRI